MDAGTLSLAVGAGMVAALNPCGFALLPAYLSLLVLPDGEGGRLAAVRRALVLTGVMTLGFVAVFAAFGLVISPIASSAQQYLPWVTVAVGVLVVGLGGWLAAGRELPTLGRRPAGPVLTRRLSSMFLFGASYALASLTCTVGPFLAIVVASFRADSAASGSVLFVAYALGMGAVVGTAAVAVALANRSLVTGLRRSGRWVPRAAGALLVVVGVYVAYYGWWEIRVLEGADAQDPVVGTALRVQAWAAGAVQSIDAWVWLVVLAGLVLAAVAAGRAGRALRRTPSTDPERAPRG